MGPIGLSQRFQTAQSHSTVEVAQEPGQQAVAKNRDQHVQAFPSAREKDRRPGKNQNRVDRNQGRPQ